MLDLEGSLCRGLELIDTPLGRWDKGCSGTLGYAEEPAPSKASKLRCCMKKEQIRQGWCGVCQVSRVLGGAASPTLESLGHSPLPLPGTG